MRSIMFPIQKVMELKNYGKHFGYCWASILDFVIYFVMGQSGIRNVIFILFGLVKAYYIVGAFMHMKNEKVNLAMIIIVPTVFIFGLIWVMLYEGGAITDLHTHDTNKAKTEVHK